MLQQGANTPPTVAITNPANNNVLAASGTFLLAAVGDRALGWRASQFTAIGRWAHARHSTPVTVKSIGPRSSD
jgi:hypothetical protein